MKKYTVRVHIDDKSDSDSDRVIAYSDEFVTAKDQESALSFVMQKYTGPNFTYEVIE